MHGTGGGQVGVHLGQQGVDAGAGGIQVSACADDAVQKRVGLVERLLGGADGDGGRRAPVAASSFGGRRALFATSALGSRSAFRCAQGLGCLGQRRRCELGPLAGLRRVARHRGQSTIGITCPQVVQGGGGSRQAGLDMCSALVQHRDEFFDARLQRP